MFLILILGLALIGIAVVLVLQAAATPRARTVENLGQIESYGFGTAAETGSARTRAYAAVDRLAGKLGDFAAGHLGRLDEAELKTVLMSAGFYSVSTRRFTGYRLLCLFTTGLLWLWIGITSGFSAWLIVIGTPLLMLTGWMAPLLFARSRARRRLDRIDYDLPELIDLLVVTVEAGLGFNASIQMASTRLGGPLGQELRLSLQEQAMGLSTQEALRHMLNRADTPAMRSFVRSMLQGETLGVSIGQIMRNLAHEMRKRRRAAAEERAQKAPIKILFPLIFLIFPAMFVILLGPAIYSFTQAIGG